MANPTAATPTAEDSRTPAPALDILDRAQRWAAHAGACGTSKAYAGRKALEAARFSLAKGASGLCIPSKLVRTKSCQDALEALSGRSPTPGRLHLDLTLDAKKGQIWALLPSGERVGRLQAKHTRWMRGILQSIAVSVLQVTGGTEEKPTRGLNVVIWFPPSRPVAVGGDGAATGAPAPAQPNRQRLDRDGREGQRRERQGKSLEELDAEMRELFY